VTIRFIFHSSNAWSESADLRGDTPKWGQETPDSLLLPTLVSGMVFLQGYLGGYRWGREPGRMNM